MAPEGKVGTLSGALATWHSYPIHSNSDGKGIRESGHVGDDNVDKQSTDGAVNGWSIDGCAKEDACRHGPKYQHTS